MMMRETNGLGIGRRSMVQGMLATAGMLAMGGGASAAAPRPFFQSKGLKIGLELYTLGDGVAKDLEGTMARVAAMGYREVELPNLFGRSPRDFRAAADKAGLAITSMHLPLVRQASPAMLTLGSDPARIGDTLGELGARWAVAPLFLLPKDFHPQPREALPMALGRTASALGETVWRDTAQLLNERAAALKPLGIQVAYHNHNVEFAPVGQRTGYDILLAETDPTLVHFEVDIGWVVAGGLDPVAFLKHLRGRASHLHVKDVAKGSKVNFTIGMDPTEVGTGVLPWRRVLDAAYEAGVRHFYVEQEPPFRMPREDSARLSYDFLARI